MKQATYLLMPGLNDQRILFKVFYRYIEKRWGRAGLHTVLVPMHWETGETLAAKRARVEKLIKNEQQQGREVVLVGVSAGASLAVTLFGARHLQVRAVVSIAGFLRRDSEAEKLINKTWYQSGQACEKAVEQLTSAEKRHILTFYPQADAVVDPERAQLPGAKNSLIPISGHMRSIVFVLLRRTRVIRDFAADCLNHAN